MKKTSPYLNDIVIRPLDQRDLDAAAILKAENTPSQQSLKTLYDQAILELRYEWLTHPTNVVVAYDKNDGVVVGVSERKNYRSATDLTRRTYLNNTLDTTKAKAIEIELSEYGLALSKKPRPESVKAGERSLKNR